MRSRLFMRREYENQAGSDRRPTLLVLTSTFPRWEHDHIPSFVLDLSKRLTNIFDVVVLAPHCRGAKRHETLNGVEVYRFVYWPGKQDLFTGSAILPTLRKKPWLWLAVPVFLVSQFISLVRIMRSKPVRLIHAHWLLPQGLLAVLYRMFSHIRIQLVVTTHGGDVLGLKPLALVKRFVLGRCDAVAVVSNALREEVCKLGVHGTPVEVIPMGVDMELFHPSHRDDELRRRLAPKGPLLLFVGRLSEKKGVRYLLDAMPRVLDRFADATLVLVGDGEERVSLERRAREAGIPEGRVVFYGGVANRILPRFYATADVFVGPSVMARGGDAEGFGLVFVEALACSCPVVATDLPAIRDIVVSGANGIVIPQASVSAIAEALLGLLGDEVLRDRLKTQARPSVVDRYDWDIIGERYAHLLGEGRFKGY